MFDFSGRTLLPTWADGGIERAIATTFYRCGVSILLADVNEGVTDLAMSLGPTGRRTSAMTFDVGHPADAVAAVDRYVQRFGRLDFVGPGPRSMRTGVSRACRRSSSDGQCRSTWIAG
jgi:NAD(P)-dependent dehydrogenase (short-subunit alcohol dehydrogenase family)